MRKFQVSDSYKFKERKKCDQMAENPNNFYGEVMDAIFLIWNNYHFEFNNLKFLHAKGDCVD